MTYSKSAMEVYLIMSRYRQRIDTSSAGKRKMEVGTCSSVIGGTHLMVTDITWSVMQMPATCLMKGTSWEIILSNN